MGRAKLSCCRSARPSGRRLVRPEWQSPSHRTVPGPTRTGFVDALGADVGHTAIYGRLADPEPVIEAGLRALDKGRAVVIPGVRNKLFATSGICLRRLQQAMEVGCPVPPVSAAPSCGGVSRSASGEKKGRVAPRT
jgi:hypothetical protein